MKRLQMFVGLVSLSILISGCLMTRSQIREEDEKAQIQTQLQETKAQSTIQYADMEEQVRDYRGRLEVVENNLRLNRSAQMEERAAREKEKQAFEEKLRVYEEAIGKLEKEIQTLNQKINEKQSDSNSSSSKSSTKKKNNFETAEDHFNKKKWREAIVEYQNYRDKYPSGKSYADATYKIGVSFQELGMKSDAKAFYSEVVSKFPKSQTADKAKVRLKQIK